MITYIQSDDFRKPITNYIIVNCQQFSNKDTSEDVKVKIFNGYVSLYNDSINGLFQNLGVPEDKIQPTWNYLLTSEDGMQDTCVSSEFLSAQNYGIFGYLMEYYEKRCVVGNLVNKKVYSSCSLFS